MPHSPVRARGNSPRPRRPRSESGVKGLDSGDGSVVARQKQRGIAALAGLASEVVCKRKDRGAETCAQLHVPDARGTEVESTKGSGLPRPREGEPGRTGGTSV